MSTAKSYFHPTTFGASMPLNLVFREGFINAPDSVRMTTRLCRLMEIWCNCSEGGRLPGRADIPFADSPDWTAGTMLVSVSETPENRRFRFSVVGDLHKAVTGSDSTGLFFDEIPMIGDDFAGLVSCYDAVVDQCRPHYWMRRSPHQENEWVYYERILLPLAKDGKTVDTVLSFMEPFRRIARALRTRRRWAAGLRLLERHRDDFVVLGPAWCRQLEGIADGFADHRARQRGGN